MGVRTSKISEYLRRLVWPLLRLRPRHIPEDLYARWLFSTDSRVISSYRVRRACSVPGLRRYPQEGATRRAAAQGDIVWCRIDDSQPLGIDVEHEGQVFYLSPEQWQGLRENLSLMSGQEEL